MFTNVCLMARIVYQSAVAGGALDSRRITTWFKQAENTELRDFCRYSFQWQHLECDCTTEPNLQH